MLTIAVSLFLAGVFLLVSRNLARTVDRLARRGALRRLPRRRGGRRRDARRPGAPSSRARPGSARSVEIPAEEARRPLRALLPEPRRPGRRGRARGGCRARSRRGVRAPPRPGTIAAFRASSTRCARARRSRLVDDDRDWIAQVETALAVVRALGVGLLVVLLGAAMFTIASVVRLTAYLYREEIAIMRLVGATEFFIRGPFYVEGLLQGLLGAAVSLGGLYAPTSDCAPISRTRSSRASPPRRFLSAGELALLAPVRRRWPASPARSSRSAARVCRASAPAPDPRTERKRPARTGRAGRGLRCRSRGEPDSAELDDDHRAPIVLASASCRWPRPDRRPLPSTRDAAGVDAVALDQVLLGRLGARHRQRWLPAASPRASV